MAIRRQEIVDALVTRLGTIKTTNGYHTNIGNNVFTWRDPAFQANELPAVNIRDRSEPEIAEIIPTYWHRTLYVDIDVVCSGSTPSTTVRQMMADVHKALGTDRTLGGKATDITMREAGEIQTDQEEKHIGGATIGITVKFRTGAFAES